MKSTVGLSLALAAGVAFIRMCGYAQGPNDQGAFLRVESSDSTEIVTFTCAVVSGDANSATPLEFREEQTPFMLDVPADRFIGIFRAKSGYAKLVVSAKCGLGEVSGTGPVILIEKTGSQMRTTGF